MRVLVTEKIGEAGLQGLRDAGHDVDIQLGLSPEELNKAIVGAHALIIRSDTKVTRELLSYAGELIAVGRAGVGVNNIDFEAATEAGVMVINAPTSNIVSAAEHAFALALATARHIPDAHRDLMNGQWNRSLYTGREVNGKTVGIVGFGNIGQLMAARYKAFGVKLLAYDPYVSPEKAASFEATKVDTLAELFAQSDIVTVHLPATPETKGLINAEVLSHAKPGLIFVNAARGELVVEEALADALREGRVASAGLDVFQSEPPTDSPLFDPEIAKKIVVTPHLGASTDEAQDRAGLDIGEQILLALNGDFVPYAMNLNARGADPAVAPFIAVAETCGRLAAGLSDGQITNVTVTARGVIGESDCSMLTLSALTGVLRTSSDAPVSLVNAPNVAKTRGINVSDARDTTPTDYVSVLDVTVSAERGDTTVRGTASRRDGHVRILGIDEHTLDVPRADHLVVVRNANVPNMVGQVSGVIGTAGVNIRDLDLSEADSNTAVMVISTAVPVGDEVMSSIRAIDGVTDARSISLA